MFEMLEAMNEYKKNKHNHNQVQLLMMALMPPKLQLIKWRKNEGPNIEMLDGVELLSLLLEVDGKIIHINGKHHNHH